jgi:hypothetical protein
LCCAFYQPQQTPALEQCCPKTIALNQTAMF